MAIEIRLSNGLIALVSPEDADLTRIVWSALNAPIRDPEGKEPPIPRCYARYTEYLGKKRTGRRKERSVYMHRVVAMRMTERTLRTSDIVDHINGNRLDNRRQNLRVGTVQQNNQNQSPRGAIPYRGVTVRGRKFRATITHPGSHRCFYIGCYDTPELAALAYDAFARKFGYPVDRLNSVLYPHILCSSSLPLLDQTNTATNPEEFYSDDDLSETSAQEANNEVPF